MGKEAYTGVVKNKDMSLEFRAGGKEYAGDKSEMVEYSSRCFQF